MEAMSIEVGAMDSGTSPGPGSDAKAPDSGAKAGAVQFWPDWLQERTAARIPRRYQLVTDEKKRAYSLYSLQFVVACSAINTKRSVRTYLLVRVLARLDRWLLLRLNFGPGSILLQL